MVPVVVFRGHPDAVHELEPPTEIGMYGHVPQPVEQPDDKQVHEIKPGDHERYAGKQADKHAVDRVAPFPGEPIQILHRVMYGMELP